MPKSEIHEYFWTNWKPGWPWSNEAQVMIASTSTTRETPSATRLASRGLPRGMSKTPAPPTSGTSRRTVSQPKSFMPTSSAAGHPER